MADRVLVVRHGATEWSVAMRHTGRTDLPLLPEGRRQAAALAPRLAAERDRVALVLCSPLLRARQTCELAGFGERAELCEDLREWDYGDYEGLTTPQIRERAPRWNLWTDGCPGGERPAQVAARVHRVLERLRATPGTCIAFAHGHVLRVLTALWLEMDVTAGARFKLEAGSLGVLGHERQTAVLERWSA
ncbi:MAG TPA: histidine phosphatase family protein [Solirubrobacteraceae bacterium]|nr:histidine phosphatase family protein [Solirubrobacteraceae bacterium]